jgi:hypothetical protein
MDELVITVNGVRLTQGQALTVHVALNAYAGHLSAKENTLGDDEHGKAMKEGYLRNIQGIQKLYIK